MFEWDTTLDFHSVFRMFTGRYSVVVALLQSYKLVTSVIKYSSWIWLGVGWFSTIKARYLTDIS